MTAILFVDYKSTLKEIVLPLIMEKYSEAELIIATNLSQAVRLFGARQREIDLVVTGAVLSEGTASETPSQNAGIRLAKTIAEINPKPVLVITTGPEENQEAERCGLYNVDKRYLYRRLLPAIRHALSHK